MTDSKLTERIRASYYAEVPGGGDEPETVNDWIGWRGFVAWAVAAAACAFAWGFILARYFGGVHGH